MEELAPGVRFYPTEEELVSFYLHHKLEGNREDLNRVMDRIIPVVDIYRFSPSQLPQYAGIYNHKDPEQWFFFIPRQESEARGGRPKRLTEDGYWKATGSPGFIFSSDNRFIAEKRTMVFYIGRAPKGKKTDWKMHEYKAIQELTHSSSPANIKLRQEMSVARVYKKSKCIRSFDRRPIGVETRCERPHYYGEEEGRQNHAMVEARRNSLEVDSLSQGATGHFSHYPVGEEAQPPGNDLFWDLEPFECLPFSGENIYEDVFLPHL